MADDGVKRGFLTKRGRVVKNWKRRYFVLKGGSLSYYEDESAVVAKGQLNLFGAAVVYVEPPKIDRVNCVEVSTPERSLFVCADNKSELQEWALAIQRAAVVASGGTLVLSSLRLTDETTQQAAADAHRREQRHGAGNVSNFSSSDDITADAASPAAAAPAPAAAAAAAAAGGVAAGGAASAAAGSPEKKHVKTRGERAAEEEAAAAAAAGGAAAADDDKKGEDEADNHDDEEEEDDDDDEDDDSEGDDKEKKKKKKKSKEERRKEKEARKAAEAAELEASRRVEFTPAELERNAQHLANIARGANNAWLEAVKSAKARHKESSAKQWELGTIKCRKALNGHKKAVNCLFRADRAVVSGADDRRVLQWGVESLKLKSGALKMPKGSHVRAVVASSELVAASSSNGEIRVWSRATDERLRTMLTSTGEAAEGLAMTEDGRALVAVHGTTVQVWDLASFECVANVAGRHAGKITCAALAGATLFTGSEDKTVRVWDLATMGELQTLEHHKNWVFCLAVAPGAERLYSGSEGIAQWDISKAQRGKCKLSSSVDAPHQTPSVQALAVTDDEHFLVSASLDGRIRMWAAGGSLKSKPAADLENKTKYIFSVATYGRRLFSADRDGSLKVWE